MIWFSLGRSSCASSSSTSWVASNPLPGSSIPKRAYSRSGQ